MSDSVTRRCAICRRRRLRALASRCPQCLRCTEDIKPRHLNTRYAHDESNWLTSCRECFEGAWDLYDEMWGDSGQGRPFERKAPPDEEVAA